MAQMNMVVGDIQGNVAKIIHAAHQARDELNADIIVFPELVLTGYPPEDLLLRPDFHQAIAQALDTLKQSVLGMDVVLGLPMQRLDGLYNSAVLLRNGAIHEIYHKQHLPNYSVFDEKRYFRAGDQACVVIVKDIPVAITICEDLWHSGPMDLARLAGGKLMLNLNASPYHINKNLEREQVMQQRVAEGEMPVVYVNLVGGQDELVFDGQSFVMDSQGHVVARYPAFAEGIYWADFTVTDDEVVPVVQTLTPAATLEESVYRALICGVKDYVEKNNFRGVVIGLSGGIDSALTLAIAVDALGKERVEAVMLPSRYTSAMSLEDAASQAQSMGVEYHVISIEPAFQAFIESLQDEFAGRPKDVTEENIQARCRGIILMAISNKKGKMVLTTGNKSEMSVGYATLYGDMAGGFAPIKDVPKMLVYRLVNYRNSIAPVIPQRVLERAPSAELAPDQKDEDSLPPYSILDAVLEMYVEQDRSRDEIVAAGYNAETVDRVISLVIRNEYKRRQAPPGVRVTRRAFGRDRRYPITSRFRS